MRLVALTLSILFFCSSLPVQAAVGFYGKETQRGWWWYEDPPPADDEVENKESQIGELPAAPAPLARLTPEQLWDLHPDQLQYYSNEMEKLAVQSPTQDNMRHYYEVQDVIRRKAAAFSSAAEYTWRTNPELSVAKDMPVATPGRNAVTRVRQQEREQTIAAARNDFALLYFRSDQCAFCFEQDNILSFFVDRHGWTVRPINLDQQPHMAARFGISTTPTLLLIYRMSEDYLPVSVGVSSVSEIETNLYQGIRLLRGETGPEDFNMYDYQRGGGFDPRAQFSQ
ncbi:conjugal transfer protein TraF [Geoalkalibacter halelectricus]|uniref:conjugal transfer protein TraF n=1 Tax=Geoalkalibacter halelectricus TaxID=2847045 RepID=UPI00266FFE1A|nr:conjugal transfer protein TraF [Geoalkalibacter halelectricus]MDO3380373.1 conjugal transfer protein TraF [Geoalkalibacter halelectricus]